MVEWFSKEKYIKGTAAFFTYEGVEYYYMGGVSRKTMKEFLETLEHSVE